MFIDRRKSSKTRLKLFKNKPARCTFPLSSLENNNNKMFLDRQDQKNKTETRPTKAHLLRIPVTSFDNNRNIIRSRSSVPLRYTVARVFFPSFYARSQNIQKKIILPLATVGVIKSKQIAINFQNRSEKKL